MWPPESLWVPGKFPERLGLKHKDYLGLDLLSHQNGPVYPLHALQVPDKRNTNGQSRDCESSAAFLVPAATLASLSLYWDLPVPNTTGL